MDVAFLGLPHKITAKVVLEIIDSGVRIVDLSGDFRLRDAAAYEKYYGVDAPRRRSRSPTASSSTACPS